VGEVGVKGTLPFEKGGGRKLAAFFFV